MCNGKIEEGYLGFPCDASGKKKNLHVNDADTRDMGLFPEMFPTIPGEGNGNPFQYFWLENCMDRGAWWATVHEAAKCQAWLSSHTHTHTHTQRISNSVLQDESS